MRKETDLTAIKNILKDFLHMPVEETEYSPIVVQHPIFESGISYVNNKMTDIMTPEGFAAVAKRVEEDIDKIDDVFGCVNILRQSYYLTFLKFAKESLSLTAADSGEHLPGQQAGNGRGPRHEAGRVPAPADPFLFLL